MITDHENKNEQPNTLISTFKGVKTQKTGVTVYNKSCKSTTYTFSENLIQLARERGYLRFNKGFNTEADNFSKPILTAHDALKRKLPEGNNQQHSNYSNFNHTFR